MKRFTFDVKMWAGVTIESDSLANARKALRAVIDLMDVPDGAMSGISSVLAPTHVSGFSLSIEEDDEPELIDPEDVEEIDEKGEVK